MVVNTISLEQLGEEEGKGYLYPLPNLIIRE
jgi:hypothetical protein